MARTVSAQAQGAAQNVVTAEILHRGFSLYAQVAGSAAQGRGNVHLSSPARVFSVNQFGGLAQLSLLPGQLNLQRRLERGGGAAPRTGNPENAGIAQTEI